MKINSIEIENFKAIKKIKLSGLENTIVIAGPNGCGKSCIFDAIRLLKSVYGGYQENEWHQWFGEFQINIQSLKDDVKRILNDKTKPVRIAICFEFTESEIRYLKNNAEKLIEKSIWNSIFPDEIGVKGSGEVPASDQRYYKPTVEKRKKEFMNEFLQEIDKKEFTGELLVSTSGKIDINPSPILELYFSSYDPRNIGLIDFHSANRTYNREQVGGINLNIKTTEQQYKNHALYNSAAKYNNVKSEMASAYIRELIAKDANNEFLEKRSLIDTLIELFDIFFPGKNFKGPRAMENGSLTFPVELEDGSSHDINELSSGEKEVLYGYLRIQNTSPKNSILLLDEPELHLNPRLIRGLPKFYHKHLGIEKNNQIWLLTHSDAFLRETVGEPGFSVFHMKPPLHTKEPIEQIVKINANSGLQAAIIDLVGDLAAYSPSSKVVIFEGGGDSDFDLKMVSSLFPEVISQINAISGENKTKVRHLHELLEKVSREGVLPYKFYSIVDWDAENDKSGSARRLKWDVYHIENYLLVPDYIAIVVQELKMTKPFSKPEIEGIMKNSAETCIPSLVTHELTKYINKLFISKINLRIDPETKHQDEELFKAVLRSYQRIHESINTELSYDIIRKKKEELETKFNEDLSSDIWKKTFRGRDILKKMMKPLKIDVKYEVFRNLIISRMRDDNYKPKGMKKVLDSIIS